MHVLRNALPAFSVHAFHQGEFRQVHDADLAGRFSVLFFYPADFTFVCPTELGDLADHYAAFQRLGVEVFALSCDTHFTHKAWHDSSETVGRVAYPMLGDPTAALARAFGVYDEQKGLAKRGTFVIDPDGKAVIAEIHEDGIGRSASELLRKVQAAIFVREHPGEVCPARWTPGDVTLKPGLDLVGKI